MFRSVRNQIHSVYNGSVRNWIGTVPYGITFISESIWYQIADPIHNLSTRSRVKKAISVPIVYLFRVSAV